MRIDLQLQRADQLMRQGDALAREGRERQRADKVRQRLDGLDEPRTELAKYVRIVRRIVLDVVVNRGNLVCTQCIDVSG